MLVLTVKFDDEIYLDCGPDQPGIVLKFHRTDHDRTRIGIAAPRSVKILRGAVASEEQKDAIREKSRG